MHSTSMILTALAWSSSILGASASCTRTARFDALPTSTPSDTFNFKSLTYKGFQVTDATDGLNPKSPPRMITPHNPFQASIQGEEFIPLSLYLGCAGPPGSTFDFVPLDCSVNLISAFPSGVTRVTSTTISYSPNNQNDTSLHRIDLSGANLGGNAMYFALSAGGGETTFFIDNLVYSDLDSNC